MKLRTVVVLASALTILVFSVISEMLSHRQVAEVFTRLESQIQSGSSTDALLASAKIEKQSLLRSLATLRLLSTAVALTALAVVLNLLWARLVNRPISLVLDRMNSMSRGTWIQPIKVERPDEIGRVVREFNLLGPRLTFVAHQFAAASKLAAMALIGQQVTRRAAIARSHVEELQSLLVEARLGDQVVSRFAVERIGMVATELADLSADLDSQFNEELSRQGLTARDLCAGENGSAWGNSHLRVEQIEPAGVSFSNCQACSRNSSTRAALSAVRTFPSDKSTSCG
jgi:methyl-accepting chemotaxis protein